MRKLRRRGWLSTIVAILSLLIIRSLFKDMEWPAALVVAGVLLGVTFLLESWTSILLDNSDDPDNTR